MVNEFADFGDIFTNFYLSRRLPSHFVEDKEVQNRVIEYLSSFDEHIKDFKIEQMQKLEIAKAEFIAEEKDEKVRRQKEIDFINGVGKLITWLLIIAVIYFIFIR